MSKRILCSRCGPKPPAGQPRRARAFLRTDDGRLIPMCQECRFHPLCSDPTPVPLRTGYREYVVQSGMLD